MHLDITRSAALLLLDSSKRLSGSYDRNALVLLETQQISIARDVEIYVGPERASKNVIIVRIGRDRRDDRGLDGLREHRIAGDLLLDRELGCGHALGELRARQDIGKLK